uniref:DUF308 domain-containing protein n=1 Tax=Candidatus Methanophaga sp. ANME-1 ERB7 TaxID=2759913 RepID=A0A7G9Z7R2_9EURY|nr:hypothetical protein HFIEAGJK_00013 [Methanosarcinales archaeon ANME-1 ERB7]
MSETEDRYLGRQPWTMAVEGIIAIIIGSFILCWPGKAMVSLTIIVGIFALVMGICALIALIGSCKGDRGVLVAFGVCSIILGCIFLAWPIETTAVLLWLIVILLVLYGISRIAHAARQPPEDPNRGLEICLGIISVVLGVLLISRPAVEGLLDECMLLGAFGVVAGIILICLAGAEWSKRKHMQTG